MEKIIAAKYKDLKVLTKMALDLWPENTYEQLYEEMKDILQSPRERILLHIQNQIPDAFIQLSIRTDYVEGTSSSPTGYIEGIYVKPESRRLGIARKLMNEGEKWLKEMGCSQVGSDIQIDNQTSYDFHTEIGFKEAGRLIAFIKDL